MDSVLVVGAGIGGLSAATALCRRGVEALLGDAAHPMRPSLGQGAYQAIEDALVLAEPSH